jgi:hypothetical protein
MREKGIQTAWLERNCGGCASVWFPVENGTGGNQKSFFQAAGRVVGEGGGKGGDVHPTRSFRGRVGVTVRFTVVDFEKRLIAEGRYQYGSSQETNAGILFRKVI